MESIFSELKTAKPWGWVALVAAGVLVTILMTPTALTPMLSASLALAAFVCLALFVVPPILRSARKGHRYVAAVCVGVCVLLLAFTAMSYYLYLVLAKHYVGVGIDRMLNIVPVVTAITAAALGWYVHYQFSSRAHRTNNSFSMVMEMRKSSEFIKRAEIVVRHFPVTLADIPDEYVPYFSSGSLRTLALTPKAQQAEDHALALERAEAISALKYILNYYEFMAAGVKANDLDTGLLLDTVSEIVIGTFDRSSKLIKYINDPKPEGQGQPLAYDCLRWLVASWKSENARREGLHRQAQVDGIRG